LDINVSFLHRLYIFRYFAYKFRNEFRVVITAVREKSPKPPPAKTEEEPVSVRCSDIQPLDHDITIMISLPSFSAIDYISDIAVINVDIVDLLALPA